MKTGMILRPCIGATLDHGTRDTDGGPRVVDDGDQHYLRGARPNHSGLTRAERVAHGHGTAADMEAHETQRRAHEAWKATPAGQAFLEQLARQSDYLRK